MRRLLLALALAIALVAGCGNDTDTVTPAAAGVAAPSLPPTLAGLKVTEEKSAAKAFDAAGENSLTADGTVYTLRRGTEVQAALQVGVLKPDFDTRDIEVRRGIREFIETGRYRWFKVADQWVGVQDLAELDLYLWFPPGGRTYEVLQVRPELADKKGLLTAILDHQRSVR